jgi:6-phosphogluconolactonase
MITMKRIPISKLLGASVLGRLAIFSILLLVALPCGAVNHSVYIGTYTGGQSKGIYVFEFDAISGTVLSDVRLAGESVNPSFLALHPSEPILYAVNETGEFQGHPSGAVSAFRIQPDASLNLINQQPSRGKAPCHIAIDATGGVAMVANYTSGTVAILPIEHGGGLGLTVDLVEHLGSSVDPQRQGAPHAHCINLDFNNRFAVAADLGVDKVFVYPFDAENKRFNLYKATSVSLKPGAGPRHFAFHPNNRFGYVINELNSTVTAFTYHASRGELTEIQTISTLPVGFEGDNSTAELFMHPSGKFLYGSNRGHHSIVVYSVHPQTGRLTWVENESTQGQTPRSFGIDPSGQFLLAANQASHSVVCLAIDPESGALEPTQTRVEVPTPVCVVFR